MYEIQRSDMECNNCNRLKKSFEKGLENIIKTNEMIPKNIVNYCSDCREESYQKELEKNC